MGYQMNVSDAAVTKTGDGFELTHLGMNGYETTFEMCIRDRFQIIFGSGTVNQVCDEVLKLTGIQPVKPQPKAEAGGSVINRFIKMLSDIFVPIIPAIVAGGLLMGINNIFTAEGLFVSGKTLIELAPQFADLAAMINLFSNAAFTFLPVLIGFSATKKFGGNPYLGAVLGMIMVHPELMNAYSYGTCLLYTSRCV